MSVEPEIATLTFRIERLERMERTVIDHDRRLIELTGNSGRNGQVGQMTDAVNRLDEDVRALRQFQVRVLVWAAAGAGATNGIFEGLRMLLG